MGCGCLLQADGVLFGGCWGYDAVDFAWDPFGFGGVVVIAALAICDYFWVGFAALFDGALCVALAPWLVGLYPVLGQMVFVVERGTFTIGFIRF